MKEAKDMEIKEETINYNDGLMIKAVGIILMFIHHFLGFPNWYIEGINFTNLMDFMIVIGQVCQMCVAIFCFITGYFYYFNKNKTYKYSIKKIIKILLSYWFVCISIMTFALIIGYIKFDFKLILKELLLLDFEVMSFCWYVRFYIVTMLILPIVTKLFNKSKIFCILINIIIKNLIIILMFKNLLSNEILFEIVQELIRYFPIVLIGYIFGYFSILNKIQNEIVKKYINNNFLEIILSISLICISLMIKNLWNIHMRGNLYYYLYSIDIICAPILIIGLINIIKKIRLIKFSKILIQLGKYSMLMWFIHCIFFNVCKKFFQPILFYFNNRLIGLILGISLSYILAVIINIPINKLKEIKEIKKRLPSI